VFIDETGASTKMARLHGRAPRGQRLRMSVPHGHWKTTTFTGALRLTGMTAPMVLDGPMTGEWFRAYVEQGWYRRSAQVTWSSWTICQPTKALPSAKPSRRAVQGCSSSRHTRRLQPDRERLLKAQSAAPQGRRPNHRPALDRHRR